MWIMLRPDREGRAVDGDQQDAEPASLPRRFPRLPPDHVLRHPSQQDKLLRSVTASSLRGEDITEALAREASEYLQMVQDVQCPHSPHGRHWRMMSWKTTRVWECAYCGRDLS